MISFLGTESVERVLNITIMRSEFTNMYMMQSQGCLLKAFVNGYRTKTT